MPDTDHLADAIGALEQVANLGRTAALAIEAREVLDRVKPETGAPPQDTIRLFAEVDRATKVLDDALGRAKRTRDSMNERVLEALDQLGLKNAPLDGGPTVYQERVLWANAEKDPATDKGDYASACAALEEAGLGEYVERTFNVQRLSAYFREEEKRLEAERGPEAPPLDPEELLPEPLRGKVRLTESRKAKARAA